MTRAWHAAVGFGMLAADALVAAQVPSFTSRVEVVRVDVVVTDGTRIVTGLQPTDFEVRDNGVTQRVDFAVLDEVPLNVILALDVSRSLAGDRLSHLQEAGRAVLAGLHAADRVALVTFNHDVVLRQGLTHDTEHVHRALDGLVPSGRTSLVDGAYAAMRLSQRGSDASNLVIVFSDGDDTASWLAPDRVIAAGRQSNASVYGVSIRGARDTEFLDRLSAVTGGSVLAVESTKDLRESFLRILGEFRGRYVISYSPSGVEPGGLHSLEVRVPGRRVEVRAREGYVGGR